MNTRQLCTSLRTLLRAAVWPGVGGEVVFASESVRVTVGPAPDLVRQLRMPVCLIAPGDAQADPQHREAPGLVVQRVGITLITAIPNDRFGEAPLMGANSPSSLTSQGRGLLELEPRMFGAVLLLTAQDGVNIQFSHAGSASAVLDSELGYLVTKDYFFDAFITTVES